MNAINASTAQAAQGDPLRRTVNEFVGLFFYGTMLKSAREHRLTDSKVGFGGRGESAFAGQLDMELAQRAGKASRSPLADAICKQLRGNHGPAPSGATGQSGRA